MHKNSYFSRSLPNTVSDFSICSLIVFSSCLIISEIGLFSYIYWPFRDLTFSGVTELLENLPQKNAHEHSHHTLRGFIESLKTIHRPLRAEILKLLVDIRTTWEVGWSTESHDPSSGILTQGVWVESKGLLQVIILRKTALRVPGFP